MAFNDEPIERSSTDEDILEETQYDEDIEDDDDFEDEEDLDDDDE